MEKKIIITQTMKSKMKDKIIEIVGTKCPHYDNVDEGFYCWKCLERFGNYNKR